MPQDRWDKVEETFHAVRERPEAERSAYLDRVCAGDEELRREVESLLRELRRSQGFMESPAGGLSIAQVGAVSLEGRTLNHYRIGSLVGSGGMAEVYRARDTRLGRDVAVKVLHHVQFVDSQARDHMYREARVLASLNHSNIASIYGIEQDERLCALVLEFVEGETLTERIRRGLIPMTDAIRIALQIASGLKAAHANGIIHRDLKPSNVKLTPDEGVKLLDFGLAKLLRTVEFDQTLLEISRQGLVMGTVAYMSPEQARGKPIDATADVWAFGCVFYEMLAGKAVFQGDTPTDIIVKIATEEPDWNSIPKLPRTVSVEVERVIRKCLQKDPGRRYPSAREIAGDLEAFNRGSATGSGVMNVTDDVHDEFTVPGHLAFPFFMFTQLGYLALYGATMYYIDSVSRTLANDFQMTETASLAAPLLLAMSGIAIRIYLISAVGWRHPEAGQKFARLFPFLLIFDAIWAASPVLLRPIHLGLAFAAVALLAYVPFAQRTLIRAIYPQRLGTVRP